MKRFWTPALWILTPLLFLTLSPSTLLRTGLFSSERAGANAVTFTPVSVITSTPLEDGTVYHIAQSNEALWSIAIAYNITVEQLKFLNNLSTNDIFEGQKLLIQRPEIKTASPEITVTATLGIPTSTTARLVTSTATSTAAPLPAPPTSSQTGRMTLGFIVLTAFLAAGVGTWLGRQSKP